jgi:hypothetical protein
VEAGSGEDYRAGGSPGLTDDDGGGGVDDFDGNDGGGNDDGGDHGEAGEGGAAPSRGPDDPELDDTYGGRDPLRFNNWMKRSATGAILTGISIGLQQALEAPRQQPAFIIEANDEPDDTDGPIELKFDPDSPANTVAIIRRPAEPDPPVTP